MFAAPTLRSESTLHKVRSSNNNRQTFASLVGLLLVNVLALQDLADVGKCYNVVNIVTHINRFLHKQR